jgi:hypothetical protein
VAGKEGAERNTREKSSLRPTLQEMDAASGQDKALRLTRHGVKARDKGVTAAEARNAKGGPAPWDCQVDGYRPGGVGEQLEDAVMEDNERAGLEGGMDEAAVMQWSCPNPG